MKDLVINITPVKDGEPAIRLTLNKEKRQELAKLLADAEIEIDQADDNLMYVRRFFSTQTCSYPNKVRS